MGRRHNRNPPFYGANGGIDKLEQRVALRTTEVKFTLDDVVRWLFPDEVVRTLKASYPYTRSIDKDGTMLVELPLPVMVTGTLKCALNICPSDMLLPDLKFLVPSVENNWNGFETSPMRGAFAQCYSTHLQFDKMRKVLDWVETHLTVAQARDYVPWLAGVLPAGHEMHNDSMFPAKDPKVSPPADILEYMRECGALMGSALLCPEITDAEDNDLSSFSVLFDRGNYNRSQPFCLLS